MSSLTERGLVVLDGDLDDAVDHLLIPIADLGLDAAEGAQQHGDEGEPGRNAAIAA